MTTKLPIPNATDSSSRNTPFGLSLGEGPEVRSMAWQFLKAAAVSTERAVEMMKLTKRQIEVTMFAAGISTLRELDRDKLAKT
jgi:hypothetical protein